MIAVIWRRRRPPHTLRETKKLFMQEEALSVKSCSCVFEAKVAIMQLLVAFSFFLLLDYLVTQNLRLFVGFSVVQLVYEFCQQRARPPIFFSPSFSQALFLTRKSDEKVSSFPTGVPILNRPHAKPFWSIFRVITELSKHDLGTLIGGLGRGFKEI